MRREKGKEGGREGGQKVGREGGRGRKSGREGGRRGGEDCRRPLPCSAVSTLDCTGERTPRDQVM